MNKLYKVLLFIIMLLTQNNMKAQQQESIFFEETTGRKDKLIYFKDDSPFNYLPLTIIKGKESGPVFTIVSGIHGYEYPPIMAVQELIKEINPDKLKGTLIIIPIANTASFYKRTPFINPVDGKNLNNAFPGSPSGTLTEQIASWITKNVISRSDVFLDIHGGDANEDLLPFVCYYNNKSNPGKTRAAIKLAEISGINHQVSYPYTLSNTEPAQYAFKQAVQDGKTALSIEAGKLGTSNPESVKLIKNAVYNMLGQMKMYSLESEYAYAGTILFFLNNQTYVKSDFKGLFYSKLKSGDEVKKGQEIGYITDEFGNEIQKINSTAEGIILYKTGTPPVNKGETLFCIGSR
ncbi:putative deacylase [Flavobacterium sp. HSC-32F16]|uniref:succinylglutamate desuccinylase/aspartoacylase family protein n=1 Tax=Flavobacterium sp. HSC-32F16 TaxID=2910964 RepID=UPI0020A4DF29|nr:M14 family metallopeptidase [Flavobacterium sp. HSC-32F16]MCP2025307.1 putative deacylase [Flavobacterium sp. HSC-32F16]